ncbi:alpha/beta hydrolase [Frankia sp. AgB32]|uniref:alpha/beta hydrolase n=1 Tax=Frankia sp. AgB32 TaxID=631119 RepID=UPI00200E3F76|nr:alpha/beta hydrolase [Frankia sp. AgB32]MCK9897093.1 alpha/beta hydrolase [Frankia sp. AgB32]
MSEPTPSMQVPNRVIPVPTSVSPAAQSILALGPIDQGEWPALDDTEGWLAFRASSEQLIAAALAGQLMGNDQVEDLDIDGVRIYAITPESPVADDNRVYLYFHGGGLVTGGGDCCRDFGRMTAAHTGLKVWAVDYRMPPESPYPAALDDCMVAYRALLDSYPADRILVGGASAGGNLAAALSLRARDEGLPLPAATVLLTPELDLTESGDSFQTNLGIDMVLTRSLMPANQLYAAGHDLSDPYLSPLFGDFDKGFPPTFLCTGTRDLFLSNTVRMHRILRAAGIEADLNVFEAMPHGGFMIPTPEDEDMKAEVNRFIQVHCPQP